MKLNSHAFWLALGIANVSAGVFIALRPLPQSQDLIRVALACRDWLFRGVDPYPGPEFATNYPPYALAFLFPLAFLPDGLLNGTWAIINAALAVFVGWLGLRLTPLERRGGPMLIGIGFFLAWESVRIGLDDGQFTLLALACGLAAVAHRGRSGRAILLAFAMIKPQVGLAFALWAILDGSLTSVLLAVVPVALGTMAFAARLGDSPFHVAAHYVGVLRHELTSPEFRQGSVELRPLLRDLIAQPAIADVIHVGIAAGTLALLVVTCRRMSPASRELFLLPLTCLWTLMTLYHPSYDLVLLWPVMVAIGTVQAQQRPNAMMAGALSVLQLALVVDVPGLWWKLHGRLMVMVHDGALAAVIQHADRLLVLALFVALITVLSRRQTELERSGMAVG